MASIGFAHAAPQASLERSHVAGEARFEYPQSPRSLGVAAVLNDLGEAVVMPPSAGRLILPRADKMSGSAHARQARARSR
jgi:hypothetical protein